MFQEEIVGQKIRFCSRFVHGLLGRRDDITH